MTPAGDSTGGRIVYHSYSADPHEPFLAELYSIFPDGSGRRRITRNTQGELIHDVSPDGLHIYHPCDGVRAICDTDPTGESSQVVLEIDDVGEDVLSLGDVAVSPNGELMAFVATRETDSGSQRGLYLLDIETEAVSLVKFDPNGHQDDPTWSPAGDLLWSTFRTNEYDEIAAIMVGGDGTPVFLTDSPMSDGNPTVSPDGNTIAFERFPLLNQVKQIYTMPFTGTVQEGTPLTVGPDLHSEPAFSPDGSKLLFVLEVATETGYQDAELATIAPTGGPITPVTDNEFTDGAPDWALIPPVIAIDKPERVDETAGTVTFRIVLDAPLTTPISVNYTTLDGTAQAGADYTTKTGAATFQPQQTSVDVVVDLIDDAVPEGSERFALKLSNPTGGAKLTRAEAPGRITDDDPEPSPSPTISASPSPSASPTGVPVANGRIAFSSMSDAGKLQIYTMNSDGTDVQHVSTDQASSDLSSPSWSRDALRLIYTALNGAQPEIVDRPSSGGSFRLLELDASTDNDPVYVPGDPAGGYVWASDRDGDMEIYYSTPTTAPKQITTNTASDEAPTVSNDGRYVVYHSDLDGDFDLYRLELSSSYDPVGTPVNLTQEAGAAPKTTEVSPDYALNTNSIVFSGNEHGDYDIFKLDLTTMAESHLTTDAANEYHPTMSPDGTQVAFVRDVGGNLEIFRQATLEGQTATNISNYSGIDQAPDWGPAPGAAPLPRHSFEGRTQRDPTSRLIVFPVTLLTLLGVWRRSKRAEPL